MKLALSSEESLGRWPGFAFISTPAFLRVMAMEDETSGDEGFPEDEEHALAIKHHDREFREPDVSEREYQLHNREFEFQQAQADAQKVAAFWQRVSTVFLGVCSLLVALALGATQIQMQIAQNQLAESQSQTQEEVARIGLSTASYQAQADLLLALGKDEARPRQAARALAQFGEQAIPPLILILLKENDAEILEATEEAFVSIHEYKSHKGNGDGQSSSRVVGQANLSEDTVAHALDYSLNKLGVDVSNEPGIQAAVDILIRIDRLDVFWAVLNKPEVTSTARNQMVNFAVRPVKFGEILTRVTTESERKQLLDVITNSNLTQVQRTSMVDALTNSTRGSELEQWAQDLVAFYKNATESANGQKVAEPALGAMVELLDDLPSDSPAISDIKDVLLDVFRDAELPADMRISAIDGLTIVMKVENDERLRKSLQDIADKEKDEFVRNHATIMLQLE